jgi:acyl-CoA thioesterase I
MIRVNKKSLLSVVLIGGAVGWFYFQPPAVVVNAPPRPGPIVALGDSLTQGVGAPSNQSYPDQLAAMLGRPVINAGVGGDTVAQAAERVDRDVLTCRPAIVIVLLGGNDLLHQDGLDQAFAALEQVIRRIQGQGAMVVLVGISDLMLAGGLEGRYKKVAEQTGALYVPNILGGIFTRRSLMSDQVHPNAQGYRRMAQKIAKALAPYLKNQN